jgi:hypothetical protein
MCNCTKTNLVGVAPFYADRRVVNSRFSQTYLKMDLEEECEVMYWNILVQDRFL